MRMLLLWWYGRAMPAVQKIGIHQVGDVGLVLAVGRRRGQAVEHRLLVVDQLGVNDALVLRRDAAVADRAREGL